MVYLAHLDQQASWARRERKEISGQSEFLDEWELWDSQAYRDNQDLMDQLDSKVIEVFQDSMVYRVLTELLDHKEFVDHVDHRESYNTYLKVMSLPWVLRVIWVTSVMSENQVFLVWMVRKDLWDPRVQ